MRFFDDLTQASRELAFLRPKEIEMTLKTEAVPARAAHPAIADAIELLTQSAKDLADCLSFNGKKPNWKRESEAKVAYDKDLSTAAALRTVQAEIEAPLLLKINMLQFLDNAKTDEIKALEEINAEMLAALLDVADAEPDTNWRSHQQTARTAIAKSAQPTIIRLPADDTEGGGL